MTEPVTIATIRKSDRERVRVALTTWRGLALADVRICIPITEASGVLTPTAKGVSLPVAMLPQLAAAVVEAEATARRLGLIGEGGQ